MDITIETIFKRRDSETLCRGLIEGTGLARHCTRLVAFAAAGGAIYGFTMGLTHSWLQALSSAAKVFVLFSPWIVYDGDFRFFVSGKGDFFSYVFEAFLNLIAR